MTAGHSKKMGNLREKLFSINKVRLVGKLPRPPNPRTELMERAQKSRPCKRQRSFEVDRKEGGGGGNGEGRLSLWSVTTCINIAHSPATGQLLPFVWATIDCLPRKATKSLRVGVLLLHRVKATFSYYRRRAGLWLVLGWEMRWTHTDHMRNGSYALQCGATLAQVNTVDGFLHSFVRSSSATVHDSLLNT